jgi:hypothetical protein
MGILWAGLAAWFAGLGAYERLLRLIWGDVGTMTGG